MNSNIKIIQVQSDQDLKNNVCENLKKELIANITAYVGIGLISLQQHKLNLNNKIEDIINNYLYLYQIINIDSKKELDKSFELNEKILISRVGSKTNKVQENETIDKLLLNTVVSLTSVNNNDEKLSIKSVAKLINFLYSDLDMIEIEEKVKKTMEEISEKFSKEIRLEKEIIKGKLHRQVYKENHNFLDTIFEETKSRKKIIYNKIKEFDEEKFKIIKTIKNDKTQKSLKNLVILTNLKQVLRLEDIEKVKKIDKSYLEKYLTNEELFELFKEEKYKKNMDILKTKYKEMFKDIEKKNIKDMSEKEKLYLNNKIICNSAMFNIFEYVIRNEEKSIAKDYFFKLLSSKENTHTIIILMDEYVNFIKEKMSLKQDFTLNKFFKLESVNETKELKTSTPTMN